jgi:hypothetical protein
MLNLFWEVRQWRNNTYYVLYATYFTMNFFWKIWEYSGRILFYFILFSRFGETLNPKPKKDSLRTALRLIHINQVQIKIFWGGKFLPNGELFKMAKM